MDVYTTADAIKAEAPRDTDIGYQKVESTITNGIKPTANAGGIWTLNGLGLEGRLEPIRIHGALCARNRMFANRRAPANADEACRRHARRENIFS
jgi:hypothetical protein